MLIEGIEPRLREMDYKLRQKSTSGWSIVRKSWNIRSGRAKMV